MSFVKCVVVVVAIFIVVHSMPMSDDVVDDAKLKQNNVSTNHESITFNVPRVITFNILKQKLYDIELGR